MFDQKLYTRVGGRHGIREKSFTKISRHFLGQFGLGPARMLESFSMSGGCRGRDNTVTAKLTGNIR